ncbi:hypothetical protein NC651_029261 [Populus alba x Populus x berolinensis]|nr:hypothetical protein NC651_029261 [Populus alba x Populus x berolinensis]
MRRSHHFLLLFSAFIFVVGESKADQSIISHLQPQPLESFNLKCRELLLQQAVPLQDILVIILVLLSIYAQRLDDPSTRTSERCSSDSFQISGPCGYQICSVYLYRSGPDGWKPDTVRISGKFEPGSPLSASGEPCQCQPTQSGLVLQKGNLGIAFITVRFPVNTVFVITGFLSSFIGKVFLMWSKLIVQAIGFNLMVLISLSVPTVGTCAYTLIISTSCLSPKYTTDQISVIFGDAFGNQVFDPKLVNPFTASFVTGSCSLQICYIYFYRNGTDGWIPESVKIYGSFSSPALFFFNSTNVPEGQWYGIDKCQHFPAAPPPPSSAPGRQLPGWLVYLILGIIATSTFSLY